MVLYCRIAYRINNLTTDDGTIQTHDNTIGFVEEVNLVIWHVYI